MKRCSGLILQPGNDLAIGWKGKWLGHCVQVKEPYSVGVVSRDQLSADAAGQKPDSACVIDWIMEIRVDGEDRACFDEESGFLEHFPFCRRADPFIILDVSARDAPSPWIDAAAPHEQHVRCGRWGDQDTGRRRVRTVRLENHGDNSDLVAVVNIAALGAVGLLRASLSSAEARAAARLR